MTDRDPHRDEHMTKLDRRYRDGLDEYHREHNLDHGTNHRDALAIVKCDLCDGDGYRGSTVCDHQDHAAAAQRGMAKIREALGKDGS